jgi:hypothetical protein
LISGDPDSFDENLAEKHSALNEAGPKIIKLRFETGLQL